MKAAFTTALLLIMLLDINIADARKRKKRTDLELNSDADVLEYLERQEQDMLIFKCKRLVMVKWLHSVLPYIDLQCQVMGDVIEVQWFYNDTLLDTGNMASRHMSLSQPHYRKGTFYDKWFDYKLRLLQVTEKDNGWYTIKAKSPQGLVEQGIVLLEVKTNYSDDKWIEWMEKVYKDSSDIHVTSCISHASVQSSSL
ncbi:hypothetical protein EB796_000420 [Bugula neritina]|uniref:Immunoglobulin I-set domain-containing protein n=1 Tax=Bugula neritina TaxID=10212 RepID=A0A7J7KT67_BUGNE|nr:hypothetical protein EB796_000420 [Bugula neritina]